jgi:3-hydroxyacyl-CoA dehydrogenase
VVATAFELAKKLKKVPVRAGVCDGFIGNRILAVYKQAADYIMEDGASPTRSTRPCAALALPWARSR